MSRHLVLATALLCGLAACSSTPLPPDAQSKPPVEAMGTSTAVTPATIDSPAVPMRAQLDAASLLILNPSANRPYTALGTRYEPLPPDRLYEATGWASWYGVAHQGQPTASGEVFDMNAFTAAHPVLPIPSYAKVTNVATGTQAIVRVNDRGPFREKRVMDVSLAAAKHLGFANQGLGKISVRLLSTEEAASWLRAGAVQPATATTSVQAVKSAPLTAATATAPATATATAVVSSTPKPVSSEVAKGFYAQLGAYKDAAAALVLAQRADQAARDLQLTTSLRPNDPLVQLVNGDSATGRLARVLAGPFATRAEADKMVASFGDALGIKPFVIQQK